jgi:drug/metabolite transporter (DMT)-like permease
MALKLSIIMSIISIIMLVIYGADVVSAGNEKTGFLHMDASVRGSIFGIIPSAMLITSYFITRKEPSKKVGGLIITGGALIIVGIVIILSVQENSITERGIREFGAVLAIGVFITILGGIKIKKSLRVS